jgi:short subunit dehydrogenase-like uncharacterized protein
MDWLIYGANGYTGRLIAREAVRRGLSPILAGRNENAIRRIAEDLELPFRVFDLAREDAVRAGLDGVGLVLHCAGPFSATCEPMLEACLVVGAHYLDITGEIDVFQHCWTQADRARRKDIVVCPGTGFDVVPTDCLAAKLVEALPAATHLALAFEAGGGPSPGTARTSLEKMGDGGRIRRDGEIIKVPTAWKTRKIPFAHAERTAVTIPWGDVFTAWASTGVPNVEVYLSVTPASLRQLKMLRWLGPMMSSGFLRERMRRRIERTITGPDEDRRKTTGCQVWGEVSSADGRNCTGTLTGPNGYDFTVLGSLGIVERLIEEQVEGGYYTPSLLMGAGYAASLPGVSMQIDD